MAFTITQVTPAQFREGVTSIGPGLFSFANRTWYYVCISEVGAIDVAGQFTKNFWIMKTTNNGGTWSKVYDSRDGLTDGLLFQGCVADSRYIYISCGGGTTPWALKVKIWDTATDAFISDMTQPSTTINGYTFAPIALFPNGNILIAWISGTETLNDPDGHPHDYTRIGTSFWNGSTWTDTTAIGSGSGYNTHFSPEYLLMDSTNSVAHLFISGQDQGASATIYSGFWHISIDSANNLGTLQQITNRFLTAKGVDMGLPCIFSNTGELILPYRKHQDQTIFVARAGVAVDPTWTNEQVATFAEPPFAETFPFQNYYVTASVSQGGTLYVFIAVDTTNDSEDPTCQSFVYYSTNTGLGLGWSAITLVDTGTIPTKMLTMYPAKQSETVFGLYYGRFDPILFNGPNPNDKYNALTNWFLTNAAPTPAARGGWQVKEA